MAKRGEESLIKVSTKADSQSHKYNMTRRSRSFLMSNLNEVQKKEGQGPGETATPALGVL